MRNIILTVFVGFGMLNPLYSQNPWQFVEISDGIKPTIFSGENDMVHVAAMKESISSGFINYSKITSYSIETEIVEEEYFYGPIDIALDNDQIPIIAFHHHNIGMGEFRGELVFATSVGPNNWTVDVVSNRGHDGWDGTFTVDQNNQLHSISTDPSNGVEYATGRGSNWMIETVDSSMAMYQYGTDIHLDPFENVHTTFFIDQSSLLKYASRSNNTWQVEVVDTNAVFPKMILGALGPVIAYYKTTRVNGTWGTDGVIMVARKIGFNWQYEQVATLEDVATGVFTGAREVLDLQLDSNGVEHLAFGNNKIVRYGTHNGSNWNLDTVFDVTDESFDLGQQVSLALSPDGNAHIVTYRRTDPNDGRVFYGTNGPFSMSTAIVCPPDTTISCNQFFTPDITGMPESSSNFSSFEFVDSTLQSCPGDIIIQRSWIGFRDSVAMDTCHQIITILVDSLENFELADTLIVDEVCFDDLDEVIQTDLSLPCNVGIDSIKVIESNRSCDQIVVDAIWSLSDECRDTAFQVNQTIIIDNRQVARLNVTLILPDTGNASGSIALISNCPFDSLSYQWSNGSMDSVITNLAPDTYMVTLTNAEGCMDTLSFEVPGVMMDTMMMDTMMMEIGMSLGLNILSRDSVPIQADSVYFITMDSTEIGASIDSSGNYTADLTLSDIDSICLIKEGVAIDHLSVTDLTKGRRLILQLSEGCPEDRLALDVNDNGSITAFDLALMRNVLLDRIQTYPSNITYKFVKTNNGLEPGATDGICISLDEEDRLRGSLDIIAIKLGNLICDE